MSDREKIDFVLLIPSNYIFVKLQKVIEMCEKLRKCLHNEKSNQIQF
jgi:hypothetical protein